MKAKHSEHATVAEPIPQGFHTITPFLVVKNAEKLLDFIEKAFDGETTSLMKHDGGKVMHATSRIGDSVIMIADSDDKRPPIPAMLYLYVEDVDTVYEQALEAGGESMREPTNEFYGDRSAGIKDAWNNHWWIATHIEQVEGEELKRRAKEFNEKNPM